MVRRLEEPIRGCGGKGAPTPGLRTAVRVHCVGGGGGNRTRVRKGSYWSFYTLSRLVFLSHRPPAERQTNNRPASKFRPAVRGVAARLSRICVTSSDRPGQAIRETSRLKPRGRADCCQLLICHLINEVDGASACYSSLFLPVESSSPPNPFTVFITSIGPASRHRPSRLPVIPADS